MTARGRPRLPPEERTKQITICLPQWLVDALTDEARESGASVSRVIRADLERTRPSPAVRAEIDKARRNEYWLRTTT